MVGSADPVALMAMLVRLRTVASLGDPLVASHGPLLPAWFREQVVTARSVARHAGLLHHGLTARVARALAECEVPVVPLKGAALADAVHGDLGARISSDIDLLVAPDDLEKAMAVLTGLGWREDPRMTPRRGLPRLHRVLQHDEYPPIEVHWRVHWYEDRYSTEVLRHALPTDDGWLRARPADELAFLLLFLARDGFAGLRQVVDVAAWWRAVGAARPPGSEVCAVGRRHPALASALGASAVISERLAGLAPGSLFTQTRSLSRSQRMALRLANPWLEGSTEQISADVSLVDGLLAPPGSARAFIGRSIVPPAREALLRHPELEHAGHRRVRAVQAAHAIRVVGRYLLAGRRLMRRGHG